LVNYKNARERERETFGKGPRLLILGNLSLSSPVSTDRAIL
jgi:hypothetical protein